MKWCFLEIICHLVMFNLNLLSQYKKYTQQKSLGASHDLLSKASLSAVIMISRAYIYSPCSFYTPLYQPCCDYARSRMSDEITAASDKHVEIALDSSLYAPTPEEVAFMKKWTNIEDEEELKEHVIAVQKEAWDVSENKKLL